MILASEYRFRFVLGSPGIKVLRNPTSRMVRITGVRSESPAIKNTRTSHIAHGSNYGVTVNFSRDDAFIALSEAGFDRTKKTLFLWEGVTLYLSEADVRKTMQDVCGNAPAGSVLLADIYADSFVKTIGGRSGIKETLEYTNEELAFSLSMATTHEETLKDFVESESMSVGEAVFMGSNSDKGPFMTVVEMQR